MVRWWLRSCGEGGVCDGLMVRLGIWSLMVVVQR